MGGAGQGSCEQTGVCHLDQGTSQGIDLRPRAWLNQESQQGGWPGTGQEHCMGGDHCRLGGGLSGAVCGMEELGSECRGPLHLPHLHSGQ